MSALTVFLPDEQATLALGADLEPLLEPGLVIYLRGELGAGKTTLARGVLRALGHEGPVRSPTYTLVEVYELSRLNLHHFDFYRFNDPREWIDAGFRESFNPRTVGLIEWPEKAAGTLPPADLEITLTPSGIGRSASFIAASPRGRRIVESLMTHGDPSSAAS
jgi:tRNA threonylcarbamoyladenosine biosynthesis protein TsaE